MRHSLDLTLHNPINAQTNVSCQLPQNLPATFEGTVVQPLLPSFIFLIHSPPHPACQPSQKLWLATPILGDDTQQMDPPPL